MAPCFFLSLNVAQYNKKIGCLVFVLTAVFLCNFLSTSVERMMTHPMEAKHKYTQIYKKRKKKLTS